MWTYLHSGELRTRLPATCLGAGVRAQDHPSAGNVEVQPVPLQVIGADEPYSAAKFAVEGFMEGLAPVAAEVGVRVSVIEPAAVLDTAFITNAHADPAAMLLAAGPYEAALPAYRSWVQTGAIESAQAAGDIAKVVIATLTADDPASRIQTSEYARRYVARKLADPDGGFVQNLTRSWVRPA